MDEILLIQRACQGDLEAFNCLVLASQDAVFQHAIGMLGEAETAGIIGSLLLLYGLRDELVRLVVARQAALRIQDNEGIECWVHPRGNRQVDQSGAVAVGRGLPAGFQTVGLMARLVNLKRSFPIRQPTYLPHPIFCFGFQEHSIQ